MRIEVEAYLGLGSRYSYLAHTQIDRIEKRTGAGFTWIPLVSADLYPVERNPFAGLPISTQYDWTYRNKDAVAWAEFYGVPFLEPLHRLSFEPRELVLAALAADRWGARVAMMKRLFAAVFVEDRSCIDAATLAACAQDLGIRQSEFERALADPALEKQRKEITRAADKRGVFGVPFFIVGDDSFFGNDRLVLLEHRLSKPPLRST